MQQTVMDCESTQIGKGRGLGDRQAGRQALVRYEMQLLEVSSLGEGGKGEKEIVKKVVRWHLAVKSVVVVGGGGGGGGGGGVCSTAHTNLVRCCCPCCPCCCMVRYG